MTLILPDEAAIQTAVAAFWRAREAAKHKQLLAGKMDKGERGSVTAGANMAGFAALAEAIIRSNGLPEAEIHRSRSAPVLPGFFRPTKVWDLVAIYKGELVAVVELKSQVGSFGNNFNNRTEEAIGSAVDFWTAYREGAFGAQPRPFVGWFLLVEDAEASRRAVGAKSPHFPVRDEFDGTSYLQRYDLLCQKLVREQLYSSATLIASPRPHAELNASGYRELSQLTGLTSFMATLAGHVAATAARLG